MVRPNYTWAMNSPQATRDKSLRNVAINHEIVSLSMQARTFFPIRGELVISACGTVYRPEGAGSSLLYVTAGNEIVDRGSCEDNKPTAHGGRELSATPDSLEARLRAIAARVPKAEWEKLPDDLTDNPDRYLYGD